MRMRWIVAGRFGSLLLTSATAVLTISLFLRPEMIVMPPLLVLAAMLLRTRLARVSMRQIAAAALVYCALVGLEDANLSKEELARKIQRFLPKFYVHFAPIGQDPDKRNYQVSNQRLAAAGYTARRTLDQGIQELLKGYAMEGRPLFRNV